MSKKPKTTLPDRQIPVSYLHSGETKLVNMPNGSQSNRSEAASPSTGALQDDAAKFREKNVNPQSDETNGGTPVTQSSDGKEKEKKKEIESCEEYLAAFYSGKVKSLSEKMVRRIGGTGDRANISLANRTILVDQAVKADFTLDKTRTLLALTATYGAYTGLDRSLRDFARDVVLQHPALAGQSLQKYFPGSGHDDASYIRVLWSDVAKAQEPIHSDNQEASQPDDTRSEDDRVRKVSVADIQKARRNAFLAAVLWRYVERQTTFGEFFRALRATAFVSNSSADDIEGNLVSFLSSANEKDRGGIADICRWFHDQTIHVQHQAEQYKRELEALRSEKEQIDGALLAKDAEIARQAAVIRDLEELINSANSEIRVLEVHGRGDLEKQKSRTIRALEDEIPVLSDCLTALTRDPPKIDVAKEYLATALDTLNFELRALKEK